MQGRFAGWKVLLNCAGPFSATAGPLMAACLDERVHYLDITGEIEVIEAAAALDAEAKAAGVVLMPAVGFDVVPSDCLAKTLAERLRADAVAVGDGGPDVGESWHGQDDAGRYSTRGTGAYRRSDRAGAAGLEDARDSLSRRAAAGDDDSLGGRCHAYYSTGIPNIEVYAVASSRQIGTLKRGDGWPRPQPAAHPGTRETSHRKAAHRPHGGPSRDGMHSHCGAASKLTRADSSKELSRHRTATV